MLLKLANGGVVLNYHRAALTTVIFEVVAFCEKAGKHPFDYVLEDMQEDFATYSKMQLIWQAGEATN